MKFRGLIRDRGRAVNFINAEISEVSQDNPAGWNGQSVLFEQMEIVMAATAKRSSHDLFGCLVNDELNFYVMVFVFARIPELLFFLGRCTAISVTSTTKASKRVDVPYKAVFLGRENSPEAIKRFSTRLIIL